MNPAILHTALRAEFVLARKLDHGNPNPGNIGSDFTRLGIDFWSEVRAADSRNKIRQERIERMGAWRNAIAHQDFPPDLEPTRLTLPGVQQWRGACKGLARSFDQVMARYIGGVSGTLPW